MPNNNYLIKTLKLKPTVIARDSKKSKLSYSFTSLFAPSNTKHLSLYLNNLVSSNISAQEKCTFRSPRVLVKQSYLMLSWLNLTSRKALNSSKQCGFSFLPKRCSKFTLLKAPMAHKTFSQEQFILSYYTMVVSIDCFNLYEDGSYYTLLLMNNFHLQKINIGTNLLFLSRSTYSVISSDNYFFKLH